jgi:hypothetical protein
MGKQEANIVSLNAFRGIVEEVGKIDEEQLDRKPSRMSNRDSRVQRMRQSRRVDQRWRCGNSLSGRKVGEWRPDGRICVVGAGEHGPKIGQSWE